MSAAFDAMFGDEPNGSPKPYTEEELAKLAEHLGISRQHADAEYLVGIGRQFKVHEAEPPGGLLKEAIARERRDAETARSAAKALRELAALYQRPHGLRPLLAGDLEGMYLGRFLRDAGVSDLADRLEKKAFARKAREGRPPDVHVTVAIMSLICLWQEHRPDRKTIAHGFIRDALEPLGYSPEIDELKRRVGQARKALRIERSC